VLFPNGTPSLEFRSRPLRLLSRRVWPASAGPRACRLPAGIYFHFTSRERVRARAQAVQKRCLGSLDARRLEDKELIPTKVSAVSRLTPTAVMAPGRGSAVLAAKERVILKKPATPTRSHGSVLTDGSVPIGQRALMGCLADSELRSASRPKRRQREFHHNRYLTRARANCRDDSDSQIEINLLDFLDALLREGRGLSYLSDAKSAAPCHRPGMASAHMPRVARRLKRLRKPGLKKVSFPLQRKRWRLFAERWRAGGI
jgi:hypothetical protein